MKKITRYKYLEQIRPYYDSDLIKAITGIRRCGKSEILKQIISEVVKSGIKDDHIIDIDLESMEYIDVRTIKQLFDAVNGKIKDDEKYYIFIDEIQNIKGFETAVCAMRDSLNCSIFVTGSNSKLLYGKLQEKLTGRVKEFDVWPFTYIEYLEYFKINNKELPSNPFDDYLKFGGMPQRFEENGPENVVKYLKNLHKSIIKKDVFSNHKRVNQTQFQTIANYISSTSGRLFSALSIAKQMKNQNGEEDVRSFSNIINNYADYLNESFLIRECLPFYLKGKERLNGTRKFYSADVGIRNALGNALDVDVTFALEGILFNEFKSRGFDVYYGKLRDGKEIDFVLAKDFKKCLVQVTYLLNSDEVKEREFGAFKNIDNACPKYVLSLDTVDMSRDGITNINIIDYLLGKVDLNLS